MNVTGWFSVYSMDTKKKFISASVPKNGGKMKLLMPILSLELLGGEQYLIITTELANQCGQKTPFTCVVYTLY